jgi:hypothetical protein
MKACPTMMIYAVVSVHTELIFRDPTTGLFGFRLEMERSADGARVQARRMGYRQEDTDWNPVMGPRLMRVASGC